MRYGQGLRFLSLSRLTAHVPVEQILEECVMPDDGSRQSKDVWPLPKFRFEVKWDGEVMSFQEVSGLNVETQPIEYRAGDNTAFSVVKMPGLRKYGNVTLKKGVFRGDSKLWEWFNQIKMNPSSASRSSSACSTRPASPPWCGRWRMPGRPRSPVPT